MAESNLSVFFWNVWMETQFTGSKRKVLFKYLDGVLAEHDPDIIGLNEAIYDEKAKRSYILDYFKLKGYQTHFSPFSPVSKQHIVGSALITKQKPLSINEHALGLDMPAKMRGFDGYEVKTIEAVMQTETGFEYRVVLTYLAHLVPYNWLMHGRHYKNLLKVLNNQRFAKDVIMMGDFNEPKYHPNILKLSKRYKRKTGTFLRPTWRLHGKRRYLLRANYDNLLWLPGGIMELETFEVLQNHPSDHAPLHATFNLL